ncbi:hypothetical protein BB934_32885 (plasmid) [Microvirga ossetica]|uniref:Uncharacterized protein n=1 Tax=Microvirga ossetica TaxID=1882682 RepID=A0A1B2ESP7_9HYPH|nr:hypothetical protein BB934_32885 [Microvirga ossetica]
MIAWDSLVTVWDPWLTPGVKTGRARLWGTLAIVAMLQVDAGSRRHMMKACVERGIWPWCKPGARYRPQPRPWSDPGLLAF